MVLLKLLLSKELHAIDEQTVNNGYVFFVVEAIHQWFYDENVHARLSKLIYSVWILDHCEDKTSYPKA
jgi:hypothetical protein